MRITKNIHEANVITHGGNFHCDDVMATVILKKLLGDLIIYRTDKVNEQFPEDLSNVIVYDVGCGEFDHHQKNGNGERWNGVPFASVGLIWQTFGRKVLRNVSDKYREQIWRIMDKELICGIDAVDNGVYPKVDYPVVAINISKIIACFNPTWNSDEDCDEAFLKAVEFAGVIFDNCLKNAVDDAEAKALVEDAINKCEGEILVLDTFAPWYKFLHSSKNLKARKVTFAVYPTKRGHYNWQCVTKDSRTREVRKEVPREWWGATTEELRAMTSLPSVVFCHRNGFIGGAETKEDAIRMVELAIES